MNGVTNSGPFGVCARESLEHVRNALFGHGLPLRLIESLQIGASVIIRNDKKFGEYRYLEQFEQPLFYFYEKSYMRQPVVTDPETGISKITFRLNMNINGVPCLWISPQQSTPEFRDFIYNKFMACSHNEHSHKLGIAAGAVDSDNPDGSYSVEFLNPQGIQEFLDYVNQNYMVQQSLQEEPVFTVSTYEHRIAPHARFSKHFTRVSEKNNKVMADFDNIIDASELYKALETLGLPVFKNFTV